jgi:hypothetical protein
MLLALAPLCLCQAAPLAPPPGAAERSLLGLSGWGEQELATRLAAEPRGPLPVERWPRQFSPALYERERPFERWAELQHLVSRPDAPAAAHAERCLLMLAQGRHDDAWRALAELPEAAQVAALWPRFLPGLPASPAAWRLELAPGGILRPTLPPPVDGDPRVLLEPRRAEVHGLLVGESRVDLVFDLRLEGYEISVSLRAGPAVEFACVLPCPAGFERFAEYADWVRIDPPGSPLPVKLTPGGEPWRLWGRFLQVTQRYPSTLPDLSAGLPGRIQRAGLELVLDPNSPEGECMRALAPALADLFQVPVGILELGAIPSAADPVRLRLLPGPDLEVKLGRLLSLAEQAYRLAPAR